MPKPAPLVLIVEDNEDLRLITTELLEARGLRTACAPDGAEGVALALSLSPSILVLDLALPRMSGADALKAIKSAGVSAKVIVLSGYADQATQRDVMAAGADLFLLKPVEPADLLQAVDELLGRVGKSAKPGRARRPKR